jgi:RND family efflux transporter MFP subunit
MSDRRMGVRAGAAAACLALLEACGGSQAAPPAAAPVPPVSVMTVAPEAVATSTEWIATLDGMVNAQIRPQVSGYLLNRNYREGGAVRKGDVLFEIDPRPFDAALAQARARLGEAQAQVTRAARDLQRDRPLAEQRAIAQSQLDSDIAASDAAAAALETAKAAVDTATLNLSFIRVTSLVDGVAAIATAQIGDLVGPTTLLTTISQVDPIRAYFRISEREYLPIAAALNSAGAPARLWTANSALQLILADGSIYPRAGAVMTVDREIDPKMGTIRLSASFPNPGNVLRPGQYGRVRAETAVLTNALLVPQRAVSELQGSFQIRVVTPDNKIITRTVTPGPRIGGRWVIQDGLHAGERVVVEGAAIKSGTVVDVKPFVPTPEAR